MGDESPIRTLGDYSKPSHEGYRNTIELSEGNNVVPLRSDTIRLVQNGCSFYGLRSEDPNQHLKDFLKLVDLLYLDDYSPMVRILLPFPVQFFHRDGLAKLFNDILMFQQQQGESLSEAWTRFKDLLQNVPHHGIDMWLKVQIFYSHVNPATRRTIDQSAGGKLREKNAEESWALLEDLALRDNESWNDPKDFAKSVKAISLPQDVRSTSDHRLIELENQVQRLIFNNQSNLEGLVSNFMASQDARLSKFEANFKQQQSEMTNKIDTVLKIITDRITGALPSDTDQFQTVMEIRTQQPEEPEHTLEDEFKDLYLNLPVLEVLAHAPIYNAILDKYVESLELGKNGSAFVQDCRKAKIAVGEGITRSVFEVKGIELGKEEAPYWTTLEKRETYKPRTSADEISARPSFHTKKDFAKYHLPGEWEAARDAELNPFKNILVFRRMIEFSGVIPINLKGNMWDSLIVDKID
ncbi:hypothetical protein Tco_0180003 [Tanacetum coccineum]